MVVFERLKVEQCRGELLNYIREITRYNEIGRIVIDDSHDSHR